MTRLLLASLLAAASAVALHAQTQTPVAAPAGNAPQIGRFGFDEAGMMKTTPPGDDFYAYANGEWAKTTAIPADKASYGAFDTLADLSRDRTRGILEAAGDSKIGQAYASYLDTAAIEAKGLAPIRPWLDTIKRLNDKAGYAALVAQADCNGVGIPFASGVGQDARQSDVYSVGVRQSGLGMPDRDYYLSADPKLVEARTAYQAHLAKMLTLAGEADAEARAKAVLDFETRIAQVSWTRIDNRDRDKTYNKMSVADLARTAPGFDFATYLKAVGTPVDSVVVAQPSAVTGIAGLIAATPLPVLKDQLLLRSLDEFADVLPQAFDREQFAFYGTVLSGTPQQEDRWKRAVSFTSAALSDDVSKVYVARYFPPETKAAADMLVRNVLAAMGQRIDKLDWMAPATKKAAHAKLAAFTPKIGYPERWRDLSGLRIEKGDAFGNSLRAAQWLHDYNIGHLGKPIQRWEWGMTPMTVNAYANFGMVEIVFPAAILQPPFFDPKADPAVNYGGIGAVIGHELSHHFDDQGSKFDAKGRLIDWWTPADVAAFKQRTGALVRQYDAYEPLPGLHVKGALTLGENVADLAGLSVAHDAYKASLKGRAAPVIDGFTGDQRFYLGWAQVWRRNYRDANLRNRLLTDPHSPSQQRAWVVRNLDPWYAAYQPKPGETLYLAPEQRVRIW
ncbi:putative endopeptidase [Sphingomonas sp. SORGH_AS802]|uniref:M13 family metallopeptidase n=1 Tax=unclassified Sphingomonas TaxID=196159 RepID=UPI002865D7FB|nr:MULTISPECIES: M13 family metallopeptidase [unclassified Sphingomonas]MDR6126517.1 putative endopeptidase [Sphingomonas sp. SORGH_AS_0438]MDR6136346.1 putative endopeptidase [Sphingomonas sp. SORGH_AS_0802]